MRFICLLIMLCLSSFGSAQNEYFNNTYDFAGTSQNGGGGILTSDGGYMAIEYALDTSGWWIIGLAYIDSSGSEIWQKNYGKAGVHYSPGVPGSLVSLSDGGFAYVGEFIHQLPDSSADFDLILWRFDKQGDTLWTKVYTDTAYSVAAGACIQTTDGGFAITGYDNTQGGSIDVYLLKTDSFGTTEWQQHFANPFNYAIGFSVGQSNDKGFILGTRIGKSGDNAQQRVIKTDSLGNVQWYKDYGGPEDEYFCTVRATKDGGYLMAGDTAISDYLGYASNSKIYLAKLDSAGNKAWTRKYGEVARSAYGAMVRELDDGSFIVAANVNSLFARLLKVNAQGDSLWMRYIAPCDLNVSTNYFYDVQPTSDGGFVAAGEAFGGSCQPSFQDMWVVKTNCLGFPEPPQPYFTFTTPLAQQVDFANMSRFSDSVLVYFGDGDSAYISNTSFGSLLLPIKDTVTYFSHTYPDTGGYIVTATGWACGDTGVWVDTVYISSYIGLKENKQKSIAVHPNPTTGRMVISGRVDGQTMDIVMYNSMGALVYRKTLKTPQADISALPAGLYFMELSMGNMALREKIIKY